MTLTQPRPVPPLTVPRQPRPPVVAERTLDSGLRVLVVRRSEVPLVELRLWVPFAGDDDLHVARAKLLSETMLSGTDRLSKAELAAALQALGGQLAVSAKPDRLLVTGNALARGLPELLQLLAEVLTSASYPEAEVAGEGDRVAEELKLFLAEPSVLAREALRRRMYGTHPYGRELPTIEQLAEVTAAQVRSLHRTRLVPAGSLLVMVGDLDPARALDQAAATLSSWHGAGQAVQTPPVPPLETGPLVLIDRPGSVQSSIRVGGPALGRSHAGYAALHVASTIFGGYFSSRLVANIREDKGYTYAAHAGIEHASAGSRIYLNADVATEVTAPALLEVVYELGRIATLPVSAEELENARQYTIGSLALRTATQSGLADTIVALATTEVGLEWLSEHPLQLAAVTADQVLEQAARFLAPSGLVTVVFGDAAKVEPSIRTLTKVVRQ